VEEFRGVITETEELAGGCFQGPIGKPAALVRNLET